MTHTYDLIGITCSGCAETIKGEMLKMPGILAVEINEISKEATIQMQKHISLTELQHAVSNAGTKYYIKEKKGNYVGANVNTDALSSQGFGAFAEDGKSWFETYKPVLILFALLTLVSILSNLSSTGFEWMGAMRVFMAGFFLSFSFFKFLDLAGFANSYSSYDIIAKRWQTWGYVYAFIELVLGLLYAVNFMPLVTNGITLGVMTISIVGVLQSVWNKQKIQCACMGTVFNLPMSTITIIEDGLMIIMSIIAVGVML